MLFMENYRKLSLIIKYPPYVSHDSIALFHLALVFDEILYGIGLPIGMALSHSVIRSRKLNTAHTAGPRAKSDIVLRVFYYT